MVCKVHNSVYISDMDFTIDIGVKLRLKGIVHPSDSLHRRALKSVILSPSCIFPVIYRSAGELLAVGTRFACVDLTARGRMTSIGRKRHGGGGKRAVESRSGGTSIGWRCRRLGLPS
jgi:hypothetical protein